MAFYDTQSQLINMARSKERMANAIQNRANSEAKLSQERANAITKGLENVASIAASQIGEYKKEKRDKELLASVVPTLGATEAQKEALSKASNLDEAAKIATIQQANTASKSFGAGKGVTINSWTGQPTFWNQDNKPTLMANDEGFKNDLSSMSREEIQDMVDKGGLVYEKGNGSFIGGYYPTNKFSSLRKQQIKNKAVGK